MFVSSGLNIGGAEKQLILAANHLVNHMTVQIVSLTGSNEMATFLDSQVTTQVFQIKQKPWHFVRLIVSLRKYRPDLMVGWMYHGAIIGTMAKLFADPLGKIKLVWSIRSSVSIHAPLISPMMMCLTKVLSRLPRKIFFNSLAGKRSHIEQGFDSENCFILWNALSEPAHGPSPNRSQIRARLRIPGNRFVFGLIGRNTPLKNLDLFLKIASRLPQLSFAILTDGADGVVTELENVFIYSTYDVAKSDFYLSLNAVIITSFEGEGMPNVALEAKSIGIPVISTKTGDIVLVSPDLMLDIREDFDKVISAIDNFQSTHKGSLSGVNAERGLLFSQAYNNTFRPDYLNLAR